MAHIINDNAPLRISLTCRNREIYNVMTGGAVVAFEIHSCARNEAYGNLC